MISGKVEYGAVNVHDSYKNVDVQDSTVTISGLIEPKEVDVRPGKLQQEFV